MDFFFLLLVQAFKQTCLQFAMAFGVFIVGGLLLSWIAGLTNNVFRQFVFPNFGMYIFGIVGVPVHEFSHVFFCKLFLHEVRKIKWFDPKGRHGAHGSVTHYYNPYNLYHRIGHFFIGLGPAIVGPLVLAILFRVLVPGAAHAFTFGPTGMAALDLTSIVKAFFASILVRANFSSFGFYVFIYFAIAISSQIELSREDLKQARTGIIPLVLVLFVVNVVAAVLKSNWHSLMLEMSYAVVVFWSCVFLFASLLSVLNLIFWTMTLGLFNRLIGALLAPFRRPS